MKAIEQYFPVVPLILNIHTHMNTDYQMTVVNSNLALFTTKI